MVNASLFVLTKARWPLKFKLAARPFIHFFYYSKIIGCGLIEPVRAQQPFN
jgi:hypothetical protein